MSIAILNQAAEAKILEALQNGELDNLPGAGKPVNLDDDRHIPEEMRMACRILKNAGYVPENMQLRQEIADTETLISQLEDGEAKREAVKRLSLLLTKLDNSRQGDTHRTTGYRSKMIHRFLR